MYEVVAEDPICVKLVQPVPWHRSTKYWLIVPPSSVEAVQDRLTCTGLEAAAVNPEGAVRVGAAVVTVATTEYGPRLFWASAARTR